MVAIGVRKLKNRLSFYLNQVKRGRALQVTDRGQKIALIIPMPQTSDEATLWELAKAGRLAWAGGKPAGAPRPLAIRGPSVAQAVIEDRR